MKSFGRNIFDEGYIEKGEGLRKRLRNPDTIKEYRKQLKELETEVLEEMKGFYDHFEEELEGHALTADDLKRKRYPQCDCGEVSGRCKELGGKKFFPLRGHHHFGSFQSDTYPGGCGKAPFKK